MLVAFKQATPFLQTGEVQLVVNIGESSRVLTSELAFRINPLTASKDKLRQRPKLQVNRAEKRAAFMFCGEWLTT